MSRFVYCCSSSRHIREEEIKQFVSRDGLLWAVLKDGREVWVASADGKKPAWQEE